MLTLVTGTPGSAKTLQTIDELRNVLDRPIFYVGIKDLKLNWTKIVDPFNFHKELPDASILVFDEVQQFFPSRSNNKPVPDALRFIETHRHKGIDLFFITQHPNLLDHHDRRLVGKHVHLQRNFGMSRSVRYTHNQLFDYKDYHELQKTVKDSYVYPKDVFELYHSAEVHTVSRKLPKKLLLLPLLLIIVFGSFYSLYDNLLSKNTNLPLSSSSPSLGSLSPVNSGFASTVKPIDWQRDFIPALEGVPYTAPMYQKLAVPVALPVVSGCVSSSTRCRCYTQQGSRVSMSDSMCRLQSQSIQFNPFKESKNKEILENRKIIRSGSSRF